MNNDLHACMEGGEATGVNHKKHEQGSDKKHARVRVTVFRGHRRRRPTRSLISCSVVQSWVNACTTGNPFWGTKVLGNSIGNVFWGGSKGANACTTGNPFLGTKLLGNSIGNVFGGALKGLTPVQLETRFRGQNYLEKV